MITFYLSEFLVFYCIDFQINMSAVTLTSSLMNSQEYSQWTMRSEHNLLASQSVFFEYLSRRLKDDANDIKGALTQSGYVQWIDTLECVFHDSTASLNWACSADSTFLRKSFAEIFDYASQSINQAFVPTIVCIVPDTKLQYMVECNRRDINRSRIQELSSFFRHHLRVGVIAESHLKRKQSLLEQVTDLKPFLNLFNFQSNMYHPNGPDFDQTVEGLKRIFGRGWDTQTSKTFAIIPAVYVKKARHFKVEGLGKTLRLISETSKTTSNDFLDKLIHFKNNHRNTFLSPGKLFLVIGLKASTGRSIMARVDWHYIESNAGSVTIPCDNTYYWDRQDHLHHLKDWAPATEFSVFLYAIYATELFLDDDVDEIVDGTSFDFAHCLCSASRPFAANPAKERFQTVVKQGHCFSDKLSFKILSHSNSWDAFSEIRNKRSHEPIISDRLGKEISLPSLHSPWVSRPAFPRPTLGSPLFLLFLMSKPGCRLGNRPGEYLMDLKKDDFDSFARSLRQLSSSLVDIRKSFIDNLDDRILKKKSFLLFKWYQVINRLPWMGVKPLPPRDVLFRTRICASALE